MLWHIEENMRERADWHYSTNKAVLSEYGYIHGWAGVLKAVAAGMEEHGL